MLGAPLLAANAETLVPLEEVATVDDCVALLLSLSLLPLLFLLLLDVRLEACVAELKAVPVGEGAYARKSSLPRALMRNGGCERGFD